MFRDGLIQLKNVLNGLHQMYKRTGMLICLMLLSHFCLALEVPISLKTLTQESDRIVRGKVMSVAYSQETNRYGDELIYTNATIRVAESLKGDRSDFVLKVEGGTLNGITLTVSDSAEFRTGEEVLVFVKKDLLDYRPLRGLSSKYTISSGGKVLQNGRLYTEFRTEILRAIQERKAQVFFFDTVQSDLVLGQWPKRAFRYYINPVNHDISEGEVVPAIRKGAWPWRPWCRARYAGTTTNHRARNDGTNTIFFRRAEYGALASAYVFRKRSEILDVDIVFWDNPWKFYAGTSGCNNGFYITDVATHEFGHAIGLGHSRDKEATMYKTSRRCADTARSLEFDDTNAANSLYGIAQTTAMIVNPVD